MYRIYIILDKVFLDAWLRLSKKSWSHGRITYVRQEIQKRKQIVLKKFSNRNYKAYFSVVEISVVVSPVTDKCLARPGRKQTRKHVRQARDFNKIEKRAVIKFLFLQRKAPKEIHTILAEILACVLPGRAKDLSASLYYTFPFMLLLWKTYYWLTLYKQTL